MADDAMDKAFARVRQRALATGLPEISAGTSYGTPSLRIKDKSFVRLKDADTLVLLCPLEQKEFLLAVAPDIYYETDHYKGWPALLISLAAISDEEPGQRLADGWRHRAPKRLAALHPHQ